jgi:hypothetical protein
MDVPLRIPRLVRSVCASIWTVTMILQVSFRASRNDHVWLGRIREALRWILNIAGAHPLFVLSIPSLYLLLLYPPLWKDVDAIAQLLLPAGAGNILHFPPVYCYFGRLLFFAARWLQGVGIGTSFGSLMAEQHPWALGIYLLVIIQHLLLVAALAYTVESLTAKLILRGLFTLFLTVCSAFYVFAHSCGSEGLGSTAIFAIFASGISIIRKKGLAHWALYGGALFLAIGCRHINILFVFWLPLTLCILMLVQRFDSCERSRIVKGFRSAGLAIAIGFLAAAVNFCIAKVMIGAVNDEYRVTLGRTLSDRIDRFLERLSEPERIRLAERLVSTTADPIVQAAIMSQAETGSFYNGTDQKIAQALARSGVPQEKISAKSDRVILDATLRYLVTLHPVLLRVIAKDFVGGFTNASNQKIAYAAFDANKSAASDKVARPDAWKALAQWPALNLSYATYLADRVRLDPYINLEGLVPIGVFAISTIGLTLYACVRKGRLTETAAFALCVLLYGSLVYGMIMVCVYYMPRYALPLFAAIVVAFLASLAAHED